MVERDAYRPKEENTSGSILEQIEKDLKDTEDFTFILDDGEPKGEMEKYMEEMASEAPIERFVKLILHQAVMDKSSDMYLELFQDEFKIRYSVDGSLYEMTPSPRHLFAPANDEVKKLFGLVERIMVPSKEKRSFFRKPQMEESFVPTGDYSQDYIADAVINISERRISMNLTRVPNANTENLHIEFFDRANIPVTLEERISTIAESMKETGGLFLLSSPVDNGKTTTAYQIMNMLNMPGHVSMMVEKKKAYVMNGGITNLIVNPSSSSYDETLRAIRAYGPRVIFFDDVDDAKTANELIYHANSGRTVIAAVNASSMKKSFDYLVDLSGSKERVLESLAGMASQILVRKIHQNCKGNGCMECSECGMKGRIPVYETLNKDQVQSIGELIAKKEEWSPKIHKSLREEMLRLKEEKIIY